MSPVSCRPEQANSLLGSSYNWWFYDCPSQPANEIGAGPSHDCGRMRDQDWHLKPNLHTPATRKQSHSD